MQIPLWLFVLSCFIFLGILVHQELRIAKTLKFFYDTDFILRKYIQKFGKIKFPGIEYTTSEDDTT